MKYLKLYETCMSTGKLPNRYEDCQPNGLCCVDGVGKTDLKLFTPTRSDEDILEEEGLCTAWWGSGLPADSGNGLMYSFTPLRQTIVLFLAAMNDEL